MMILWVDGAHDAGENMRRDAVLLERLDRHEPEPVLRLFRFDPAGITLGHAQRPERELDLERCARDGVSIAVRPTGGRAIFHEHEWTYSLAARLDDPDWGGALAEAYDRASALVLASLRRLGVAAVAAGVATGERAIASGGRDVALPCFASTTRHEILLDGRKLVGSAQRRTARALLQQGSVLTGPGHQRLANYLRLDEAARAAVRRSLAGAASEASELNGRPLDDWAAAIEVELPGVRRLDAAAGGFVLLPAEFDPYTRRAS